MSEIVKQQEKRFFRSINITGFYKQHKKAKTGLHLFKNIK